MTPKQKQSLETAFAKLLDKYEVQDIAALLIDKIENWRDEKQFFNAINKSHLKDGAKEFFADEMKMEGFYILKVENIEKQNRLNEFICKEIAPYYNEQVNLNLHLLFN